MIPRPHVRLPAWGAVAIVLGALMLGKLVRGEPLTPSRADVLVLGIVLVGIAIAVYLRATESRKDDGVADERHGEHDTDSQ